MNWISTKDRLPEKDDWYLVTLESFEGKDPFVTMIEYSCEQKKWFDFMEDEEQPTAWMPLPEPYKERA